MKVYANIGAAVADPSSSIAARMAEARKAMQANAAQVERLMAQGATREQAWSTLLGARVAS